MFGTLIVIAFLLLIISFATDSNIVFLVGIFLGILFIVGGMLSVPFAGSVVNNLPGEQTVLESFQGEGFQIVKIASKTFNGTGFGCKVESYRIDEPNLWKMVFLGAQYKITQVPVLTSECNVSG